MWGHDLRRVGRVDDAIAQFLKTDALERAYYEAEKIDPALDWHHAHNLDLLASCYQHKGQMKLAEKTLRESASAARRRARTARSTMRELPNFLIHRGRYDEALEAGRELTQVGVSAGALRRPRARRPGAARARARRRGAGRARGRAERELEAVPQLTLGPRSAALDGRAVGRRRSAASCLLRTGQRDEGRDDPQGGRARAARRAGPRCLVAGPVPPRVDGAERDGRGGLGARRVHRRRRCSTTTRRTAEATCARALVLQHQGDETGALREVEAARGHWKDADPDLPELKRMATDIARERQH